MSFYQRHAFICANQASDGSQSCQDHDALSQVKYAKNRLKELGLFGPGKVRLNKSGCMGRCGQGPVMVVYPEGTWYRYANQADVETIIQEHLLNGCEVERLKI